MSKTVNTLFKGVAIVNNGSSVDLDRTYGPVVILPFYGEYGWFIVSYVRQVHYLKSSYKIVCCRPGDEVYFPSAAEFFYDWKEIIVDAQKCGFRNSKIIEPPILITKEEQALNKKLNKKFPLFPLLRFDKPLPLKEIPHLPVPINTVYKTQHVDVVVGARYRSRIGLDGAYNDQRNFEQWDDVLYPLKERGYLIGQIGRKETSFLCKQAVVSSWDYDRSTEAIVSMLNRAKLYIGTDTGPTHLAALLGVPMVVFRNYTRKNLDMLQGCVLPLARSRGFFAQLVDDGWQLPRKVADAAVKYLEDSEQRGCSRCLLTKADRRD